MNRYRLVLVLALSVVVLAALFIFFTRDQAAPQVFPATIRRDCAPWDGAAFTLSIPFQDGTLIDVSIWQSPDLVLPKRFFFPDETMQVGNAILIHPAGLSEPLTGQVFFQRVEKGSPVEGWFRFTSQEGGQFEGRFHAEWDDQVILCG